ncbi:MAG: type I-B CRISPR-associated protein Cas7/Csh2 [Clostridiaceae bacterium]|jgi:CRISPR-associated protein Csh2|nr:type I-B CRISPR-associated protein Cas7/Csh2 [Clostridiaceae bacterium]
MIKNGQILYLYDAKLTNPNGDPDEENRPRMDYERDINLVSDLRLKRYIRDYILDKGNLIYVRKLNDSNVEPKQIINADKIDNKNQALEKYVDVRLFGATMAIKDKTMIFTGPVQFNWGYSLNKVELMEAGITSHFATGENKSQGTMGRDYRVKYSFIAFSGAISGKRAVYTKLKEDDLNLLDEAMKNAIKEQFTRSKIGQYPRLYLRVQYKDTDTMFDDLRKTVKLNETCQNIRDISEVSLEVDALKSFIDKTAEKIDMIYYFVDENLNLTLNGQACKLEDVISQVNIMKL